jgi:hypothetical protein
MTLSERIPELSDAELSNLHRNAIRMIEEKGAKQEAAETLLPQLEAEVAARKANRAEERKAAAAATRAAKPKRKAAPKKRAAAG